MVRRVARRGRKAEFETAMQQFIAESLDFPGSCEFHVVRPTETGSHEYTIVHRFANEAARRAFVESPMYAEWMSRLTALTEGPPRIQELSGIAGWFTLPGRPNVVAPPRIKMAIVTFVGVYPLTAFLPQMFREMFSPLHPLIINVITTATIVALLAWIILPILTRAFAFWLFGDRPD